MRRALYVLIANLAFACLVFAPLPGCGNPDAAAPAESAIPKPQPGAPPSSRPQVVLRFINQSSVPPADFAGGHPDAAAALLTAVAADGSPWLQADMGGAPVSALFAAVLA